MLERWLDRLVGVGRVTMILADGRKLAAGPGGEPEVAVRLTDAAAARRLLVDPEMALGELYVAGRLQIVEGTLYDLLAIAAQSVGASPAQRPLPLKLVEAPRRAIRRLAQRNTAARARANVARHYDRDETLYRLFLDRDLHYSCAYFERPGQSLEGAQRAKMRHIAAKLAIDPGHSALDIGCGFGGMAEYLAAVAGARVKGVTLSRAQLRVARARAARRAGLDLDFALQDYRRVPGRFDRIVSIGMFEHVGVSYYDAFFTRCAELLAEDGLMLLHAIGRGDGPGVTNPWITKYIFPGGYIPALSEVLPAIERAGLIVCDVEILRLHYAWTLRNWRARFAARREEAARRWGEEFCRMWEFYLAGSECSFRFTPQSVFQILLARRLDAAPVTRDYIAAREASLRAREDEDGPARLAGE